MKFILTEDERDERNPDASSFMIPMNRFQDNIRNPEDNQFTWPLLKNVISTVVRSSQSAEVYSAIFNCMNSVY